MSTPNLRQELKKQVDTADDHLLSLINALVKAYQKHPPGKNTDAPKQKKQAGIKK